MTRIIVRAMEQYMDEKWKRIEMFECNKSVAKFYELEDEKWKIM